MFLSLWVYRSEHRPAKTVKSYFQLRSGHCVILPAGQEPLFKTSHSKYGRLVLCVFVNVLHESV